MNDWNNGGVMEMKVKGEYLAGDAIDGRCKRLNTMRERGVNEA